MADDIPPASAPGPDPAPGSSPSTVPVSAPVPAADGAPEGAEPSAEPSAELDDDTLAFAHRMFDLARGGDVTLAEYVQLGVPANLTDPDGNTLVMLAAYHGHASVVAALLALDADPDRPNDRGQSPLAGAVFKGETEVVEVLLTAGADPTAGVPNALDTARMFERSDLLELLARPDAAS